MKPVLSQESFFVWTECSDFFLDNEYPLNVNHVNLLDVIGIHGKYRVNILGKVHYRAISFGNLHSPGHQAFRGAIL